MRTNGAVGIPCLVLTHGRDDINQTSLSSLIECDARLDIDVVHNPSSAETGSFIDYARTCVAEGNIRSFTLFDQNISNNAFFLFLLENLDRYTADYVVLSDGDILAPKSAIDEQIAILDTYSDILACGLRLDASSWHDALDIKKDLVERFNTPRFEAKDYVNTATGMWLTMFRGPELVSIAQTLRDNRMRLTDANIKQLGAALFQKQWVATKNSIGRELNRERPDYYETKAVSTRCFADHSPEPAGSRYATWNHDWVVPATRWLGGEERRVSFPPLPPAVPRFRNSLDDDPVVRELLNGGLRCSHGYLANHLMAATKPGLAFVVGDRRCPTGITALTPDRSALFVSTVPEPGEKLAELVEVDLGAVLLSREADDCQSILTTLRRFLAPDSLLHGIVFSAEEVRRRSADGQPPQRGLLPPSLHSRAADLAEGRAMDGGRSDAIEQFLGRLWSDEAVIAWAKGHGSLQLSKSVKNPDLAYVRLRL